MKAQKEGTAAHSKMAFARSFKGKEATKPMGATGRKTVAEHQRDRLMRQNSSAGGTTPYAC